MNTATGLILWFLRAEGYRAITMPWKTIYCTPGSENDLALLYHEQAHVAQIERDGPFIWTIKIFWYLIRYGYWKSPYEIEAREVSAQKIKGI